MRDRPLPAILATLLITACATEPSTPSLNSGHWVDLSHDLSDETVFWPTAAPFHKETVFEGMTDKGYYYSAYSFCTAEHGGTHIDAPVHFAEGRSSVDQLPVGQLIGPAWVVDVREQSAKDRDYRITAADLQAFEAAQGRIPDGAIVLFLTGFADFWPDAAAYLGTAERGEAGAAQLSFPGLHPAAAAWLLKERSIKAVGLDTASIDYGRSTHFETHVALMRQDVPAFENLAGLEHLPPTGAWVIALPVKIRGGSGAPLRAIAWVPEEG